MTLSDYQFCLLIAIVVLLIAFKWVKEANVEPFDLD